MEDPWVDEFAVAGDPDTVGRQLRELRYAGADSIDLWLFPPDRLDQQFKRIATEVLPSAS